MLQKFFDLLRDDPVAYVSFLFLFTMAAWFAQVAMYKFLKARFRNKALKYLMSHDVPLFDSTMHGSHDVAREYCHKVYDRFIFHHRMRIQLDDDDLQIYSRYFLTI